MKITCSTDDLRLLRWYWLTQPRVQFDDLLVLDSAHVCSVRVIASACDVAQLTAQGVGGATASGGSSRCGCHLHARFLLLVLLALQMLAVCLEGEEMLGAIPDKRNREIYGVETFQLSKLHGSDHS